jgi:hypothetical protein
MDQRHYSRKEVSRDKKRRNIEVKIERRQYQREMGYLPFDRTKRYSKGRSKGRYRSYPQKEMATNYTSWSRHATLWNSDVTLEPVVEQWIGTCSVILPSGK